MLKTLLGPIFPDFWGIFRHFWAFLGVFGVFLGILGYFGVSGNREKNVATRYLLLKSLAFSGGYF